MANNAKMVGELKIFGGIIGRSWWGQENIAAKKLEGYKSMSECRSL
jgi:hypothetical protein